MNVEKSDLKTTTVYSLGLGKLISKIESSVIKFFISFYRTLIKFFSNKYRKTLHWMIINILNTGTLSYYSKIIIFSSICLFLAKSLILFFKNKKPSQIEKCSFNNYLFFNNKILKNKSALLDKESEIKFSIKEESWEKISKLIEKNNKMATKGKLMSKSSFDEPFFKFLKYYLDFESKRKRE